MFIALIIFIALSICFIVAISSIMVCVNTNVADKDDNTATTSEKSEKLEDTLYSVALSCKTELQVIF